MSKRRMTRAPTTPGEVLETEFLSPLGLTQGDLASHLGCDIKTINRIVNGHTRVTAVMAVKLSAALRTSAEFWMNLQESIDLYEARKGLAGRLPKPLAAVAGGATAP